MRIVALVQSGAVGIEERGEADVAGVLPAGEVWLGPAHCAVSEQLLDVPAVTDGQLEARTAAVAFVKVDYSHSGDEALLLDVQGHFLQSPAPAQHASITD